MSAPTIFIVAAFGRSGTVWLSKVLNSNPEILAYHEGAMKHVYPRGWFEAGVTETEHWFGAIKHMAPWDVGLSTYAAVGDLNSFFGFHRIERWENEFYRAAMRPRLERIHEGTRLSFLARNPITVLESKNRVSRSNWDFFRNYSLWYGREMIQLNEDALGEFREEIDRSIEARVFFMLCLHLRCAVRFGYPRVYRLEDLSASVEATAKACEEITGVKFNTAQIEAAHAKKENALTGSASYERKPSAIWEQWSPTFKKMYARLCSDLPGRLGYEAMTPTDQVAENIVGLDTVEAENYVPHHYPVTNAQKDYEFAYRLRDSGFSPESIVDVGASDGSWTLRMAHLFPKAQVAAFEPLLDDVPKFREGLDQVTAVHSNVQVFKMALGETNGKLPMLINARPETSSCLAPVVGATFSQFVQVPLLTLDMALRKCKIHSPAFLKIDVNGFELEVLKGATETLASVEALFLEASLRTPPNQTIALFPEVVAWLGARGFYITELLNGSHDEYGLQISQRVVFMRENNRYFKTFGRRQFRLEPALTS